MLNALDLVVDILLVVDDYTVLALGIGKCGVIIIADGVVVVCLARVEIVNAVDVIVVEIVCVTNSALVEHLIVQGSVAVYVRIVACHLYAEGGYAQSLHAVVDVEEFIVGKLEILEVRVTLNLLILRIAHLTMSALNGSFDNREYKEYGVEEVVYQGRKTSLSSREEVGDVDGEYGCRYDHKTYSADYARDAEADCTADKSAAHGSLSVLIKLGRAEGEAAAPIGDGVGERGNKGYGYKREYES